MAFHRKLFSIQALLWAAMLLALIGSLRHVAHTFSSIDNDIAWGWVQAIAVDAGLFALALGISQRRRLGRSAWVLVTGVIGFSAISVYANLAYGFYYAYGETLPAWMAATMPWVLAASLPLLVIYLAEILAPGVNKAQTVAERQDRQAEERQEEAPPPVAHVLSAVNAERKAQAQLAVDALLAFYAANPLASHAQAGAAVSRSRQWVGIQLAELEAAGTIHRNGGGVTILEH